MFRGMFPWEALGKLIGYDFLAIPQIFCGIQNWLLEMIMKNALFICGRAKFMESILSFTPVVDSRWMKFAQKRIEELRRCVRSKSIANDENIYV